MKILQSVDTKIWCLLVSMYLTSLVPLYAQNITEINNNVSSTLWYDHQTFTKETSSQFESDRITVIAPRGDGTLAEFVLRKNSLVSKDLIAKFPSYQCYDVESADGLEYQGKILHTPNGIYGVFRDQKGLSMIKPTEGFKNLYQASTGAPLNGSHCSNFTNTEVFENLVGAPISIGDERKTFRLALAVTGEYYEMNGNEDAEVMTWVLFNVMGLNLIFEREMNITFELDDRVTLFRDKNTDPFEANGADDPDKNSIAKSGLTTIYNVSEYDLGHVLHHSIGDNDEFGWGGQARLRSVCDDENKARGWTGTFARNTGFARLFAHEIGHMFGANHTFNGSGGSCDDQIAENTSYEIGSGTTIMSYRNICADEQNVPSSFGMDDYFHVSNLREMSAFLETISCGETNADQNKIPEIKCELCITTDLKIPPATPFLIDAVVIDLDNDTLLYCWEQLDEDGPGTPTAGLIGIDAAQNPAAPLFRSFPPTTSSMRQFPSSSVLYGEKGIEFEALPLVARDLNFGLSVRDQKGGAVTGDYAIEVIDADPFLIFGPTDDVLTGDRVRIEWLSSDSDICSSLTATLSLNGGESYDIILMENIEYSDGVTELILPFDLKSSSEAIIKLACVDNPCFQFFNITDKFNLIDSCDPFESFLCLSETKTTVTYQSPSANLDIGFNAGEIIERVEVEIDSMRSFFATIYNGECRSDFQFQQVQLELRFSESGDYYFDFGPILNNRSFISIHELDLYDPENVCNNLSHTNFIVNGNDIEYKLGPFYLEACKPYLFSVGRSNSLVTTYNFRMTGPGQIISNQKYEDNYQYVAVNDNDSKIVEVRNDSDFRSLVPGLYTIYGAITREIPNPELWVGQSISELSQVSCMNLSTNNLCLEVIGDLDGDGYLNTDDCDDDDPLVYPGAEELCNEKDDNCDGLIDEGLDIQNFYFDRDEDGYGDPDSFVENCAPVAGTVINSLDCDDSDATINPSSIEIPNNGVDEDCDGLDGTTNVSDLHNSELIIYPNPASEFIKIETAELAAIPTTIKILSTNGQVIFESFYTEQIEVKEFAHGMYLLLLIGDNGKVMLLEKIVIQ